MDVIRKIPRAAPANMPDSEAEAQSFSWALVGHLAERSSA
jgi:hypothetical protein